MAKKQNYELNMKDGSSKYVEGEVYGNFGVHKREDKMFTITHIPSGCLVVSDDKKKNLVRLLQHEIFQEEVWKNAIPSPQDVSRLSLVVSKFYSNDWSALKLK